MKQEILSNLENPAQLEKLYRRNQSAFRHAFQALSSSLENSTLVRFWHERLNYAGDEFTWGARRDLAFVILAAAVAGFIAQLPSILSIDEEFFYPRNIGFIIFPVLTVYFAWKNNVSAGKIAGAATIMLASAIFINSLPDVRTSDTLVLSCIHLGFLLWSIFGFAFVGDIQRNDEKRLAFLTFNGELVVMTTLIVIAGGITTAVTIGLFSIIGFNVEEFYFQYIVITGLPAAPILGAYLTTTNPHLVGKVSPVIARIFSPIVLVMLVIYLVAMVFSAKDPFNDREFLLTFNVLLIGVMAIIFFSIAGASKATRGHTEIWVLFLLSAVTIIVNGIALSAILFRIAEWGVTPNRLAVMGGNVLILINLVWVTVQLSKVLANKSDVVVVGQAIARYLPVYVMWAVIVTFLFPFIFGFQ